MKRRQLSSWCLGLGLSLATSAPRAQTSGVSPRRVGVLAPSTHAKEEQTLKPFFDDMRRLGWVEGQTIVYDRAYADDRQDGLAQRAAELVARKPELIFAPPGAAAVAAKAHAGNIPIVFASVVDPVAAGLVASLARPGGNATGITSIAASLAPKRLQLLRELLPGAKRIGMLGSDDPNDRAANTALAAMQADFKLSLLRATATTPAEFEVALASLVSRRAEVVLTESSLAFNLRERLAELSRKHRLPIVGHRAQMADAGALFAYGPSLDGQLRSAAKLVDKVLRGARPADLPVEQPNLFELVVNVTTARSLDINLPTSFMLRADRVVT